MTDELRALYQKWWELRDDLRDGELRETKGEEICQEMGEVSRKILELGGELP